MESSSGGAAPASGDVVRADLLLVDNDTRIVELVSWFLADRGFTVRTAESFAAAREELAKRRPDLLVSDVDLGTESAVRELPRLHEEGVLPPTLVVSGYLDAAVKLELLDVPEVLDTLAKPFEFTDLEAKIDKCLEGAALSQAAARAVEIPRPQPPATTGAPTAGPGTTPRQDDPVEDDDGWIEITPRP